VVSAGLAATEPGPRRSGTEPLVKPGRRFINWLEGRTAWQFAVIYLFILFPAVLIGGGAVQWWAKGHFDLAFLFGYAGIFAVSTSAAATFARQRRLHRQRSREKRPPSQWWP
jgi:hypothetical protein